MKGRHIYAHDWLSVCVSLCVLYVCVAPLARCASPLILSPLISRFFFVVMRGEPRHVFSLLAFDRHNTHTVLDTANSLQYIRHFASFYPPTTQTQVQLLTAQCLCGYEQPPHHHHITATHTSSVKKKHSKFCFFFLAAFAVGVCLFFPS
jgi:hypothetical protein